MSYSYTLLEFPDGLWLILDHPEELELVCSWLTQAWEVDGPTTWEAFVYNCTICISPQIPQDILYQFKLTWC